MTAAQRIALKYLRTKFKLLSAISKKRAAQKAFEVFCTPMTRNKNALPKNFLAAEKIKFVFEGYRIQGYRWNHPAEKKLLIIHGFESSVINFDRYINPLIKKGYEILAFDAPANGRSSGSRINILLYKRFLEHIILKYGPIEHFMAHSLGGLALSITLEELEHPACTKVVLIAPATETTTAIDQFFNFMKLDDAVRTEFEKVIHDLGGHPSKWYSISRAIRHIKANVLWLHDEDDKTTPYADAQQVKAANHSRLEFVTTKGLGHSRIYRDHKVAERIIDFF